jgi:cytochrome c biogenesis protein CcdA
VVYLGADVAADTVGNGLVWLRRIAFTVAAAVLAISGVRRLRDRIRPAVTVPSWANPASAAILGLVMTAADLPNAFPYFIAIERIVNADVGTARSLLIIAGYALVYCLPCLLLLVAGATSGDQVRRRLSSLYDRLGSEKEQPRSVPVAAGYFGAAAGLLAIGFLA